jgi:hypothetical protein
VDVKVQPKKESATLTAIDNTNDVYLDSNPTLATRLRNQTVNETQQLDNHTPNKPLHLPTFICYGSCPYYIPLVRPDVSLAEWEIPCFS